jgi:lipoprotein NlpI
MKIHALYAGNATVQDVLDAATAGKPSEAALKTQLFYAHLYIGLYYEAQADDAKAKEHIALAATTYGIDGYMGDVARVHAWWLARHERNAATQPKPQAK